MDVWSASDKGKHVVGWFPYGEGAVIEWLGWASNDRLLTMSEGKLTAWDVPAAKAVWELDGGYSLPFEFAGTVVANSLDRFRLDLVDPLTGQLLNRCGIGAPGKITDIALSPDAAQLAALYVQQPQLADSFIQQRTISDSADAVVALWDLESGNARVSPPQRIERFGLLHWGSPEHLALCSLVTCVMDLRLGIAPVSYTFPRNSGWPKAGFPLNRSPDGRLWAAVLVSQTPEYGAFAWRPQTVPDPQHEKEGPFASPQREFFAATRWPVIFECSVGDDALAQRCGQAILTALQQAGFTIGPGGWVLRVTHQVTNSGEAFENGMAIPKIIYDWQLIDAKGNVAWKNTAEAYFAASTSKYHRKPKFNEQPVEFGKFIDHYDFGGRVPRAAILEEIRERNGGVSGLPKTFPTHFYKLGDTYLQQPITVEFNVMK